MSFRFKIQVADLCVEVVSLYSSTERFLQEYLLSESTAVDLSITVRNEDIDYEKDLYQKTCIFEGIEPEKTDDAGFEITAVFRLISEQLPFFDGFAFHGSAVSVDDVAYIFAARSGVGKSTHTALWRQYFGSRAIMVNDDKPFLRVRGDVLYAYGSPWNGKHNLSTICKKPLKAICILERSADNHICEISLTEASEMLMQQSLRPRQSDAFVKLVQLLDGLDKYVRFYRMGCNTDISAAKTAYDFMNKGANLK